MTIERVEGLLREIGQEMYIAGEFSKEEADQLIQGVIDNITLEETEGMDEQEIKAFYLDFIEQSIEDAKTF